MSDPSPPPMTWQITVIEALIEKCDVILLGGGMIFTFFKAKGLEVGKSLVSAAATVGMGRRNSLRRGEPGFAFGEITHHL